MKTITKAKRFMERMNNVEELNERQLVELLYRAKDVISEYVTTEDKKEAAYNRLKSEVKYTARKKTISTCERVITMPLDDKQEETNTTKVEDTTNVIKKSNEEVSSLVIQTINEHKGIALGNYFKDGIRTYFSFSKNYSHPIVFGNTSLTNEILNEVLEQLPEYGEGIKKNLKSVSYFCNIGNAAAMVHLVDYKRQVFEGYIGDYLFTTTQDYLNKGYKPLVTKAAQFVANGGTHNAPINNECSDSMYKAIKSIIEAYKSTDKYTTAMRDEEFISAKKNKTTVKQTTVVNENVQSRVIDLPQEDPNKSIIDPAALLAMSQQNGDYYDECYEF